MPLRLMHKKVKSVQDELYFTCMTMSVHMASIHIHTCTYNYKVGTCTCMYNACVLM